MQEIREKHTKITPEIVGRYLGVTGQTVRNRMKDGTLRIGRVYREKNNDSFLILPGPLYEETGIKLNGYEPPSVANIANIDYTLLAKEIVKAQYEAMASNFKEGEGKDENRR